MAAVSGVLAEAVALYRDVAPYALLGVIWLVTGAHLAARKFRAMSPADKAELLRRAPRLFKAGEFLVAFKVDSALVNRSLRGFARGKHAPGVIATLDAYDNDPDAEGITLTQGLPPMGALELPSFRPAPMTPLGVASRQSLSERYAVVRSDRPPPLNRKAN